MTWNNGREKLKGFDMANGELGFDFRAPENLAEIKTYAERCDQRVSDQGTDIDGLSGGGWGEIIWM